MADWSLPSDYNAEDSVAYARAIETLVDSAEDYHMISRSREEKRRSSGEEKRRSREEEKHRSSGEEKHRSREEESGEEKHRSSGEEESIGDAPQVSGGAEVHADGGSISDWIRTQRGILYASIEEFESKLPPMH